MEVIGSISPAGRLDIRGLAPAVWFGIRSGIGAPRLETDISRKQAKSASDTPPPGKQALRVT